MEKIKLAAICLLLVVWAGCGKQGSGETDEQRAAIVCASRLNAFVSAKNRWAQDHNANPGDTPTFDDLAPYFHRGMHKCPEGGTYTLGKVSELPQCSIAAHNDYFKAHPSADQ